MNTENERKIAEHTYIVGDKVELIEVGYYDIREGYKIGDILEICEIEGNSFKSNTSGRWFYLTDVVLKHEPTEPDFLADVPKLEDAVKMMYKGTESDTKVDVLIEVSKDVFLIRQSNTDDKYANIFACDKSQLSPIPKTIPWDSKRFHKFFSEHEMSECWVKCGKGAFFTRVYGIGKVELEVRSYTKVSKIKISEITHIKHGQSGEVIKCEMEVV